MPKNKLIFSIIFVFVCFSVGINQSGYQGEIQAEPISILSEDKLYQLGLEEAHASGLIGEPTAIYTELFPASEWNVTMFSAQVIQNPDLPVYLMAVKGNIVSNMRGGFDLTGGSTEIEKLEGLTVVLHAIDGQLFARIGHYIENPRGATTDEEREMFQSLRGSFQDSLKQLVPPLPGPIPYPVMPETTVEVIP